ncbi:MAG: DUF4340 domain-containing protein [Gammaproteobacteria bacterium]|nr:DUF4340 domain-containing protein [Gammaproteobacteria bacterium]
MARRLLLNLALLTMVAALALVVWLEPGKEGDPPRAPITTVDGTTVERIAIDYPGGRPGLILERHGEGWWLATPYDLPANAFKAGTLLDLLEAPSQGTVAVAGDDLAPFGLAPPRAVVRFDDFPVAFGATEAIDGYRYVRVDGRVHLVQDRYFPQLNTAPTGFVSYRLLPPDAMPHAIRLGRLRVERGDEGWTVEPADAGLVADAEARLARAWQEARAVAVRPHETTAAEGEEVVVELGDGKQSITFRVLEKDGDTLFLRPAKGLAYVVPEHLAERLLEPERRPEDASATPRDPPPPAATR